MELQHAAPGLSLVVVGRSRTLLLPVGLSSWLLLSLVVVQMGLVFDGDALGESSGLGIAYSRPATAAVCERERPGPPCVGARRGSTPRALRDLRVPRYAFRYQHVLYNQADSSTGAVNACLVLLTC